MSDLKLNTEWLNQKIAEFEKQCKTAGLKVTPQRIEVFKALVTTDQHPSAEVLWRRVREVFPNISLDTVNRTLQTLAEIGAAFVVEGTGDVKRFDGGSTNHQHLRCIKCRRVIDFHHEPFNNIPLPQDIEKDFTVLRKTVYIEGICSQCREKVSQI
jgi:Fur family peroxide stress response transcriptional regulator